ncbi:MAG: YedE-related selenium metabolism membrane protein [Lachnospiraceae bacterium]|nr:YedE-related selenium metabolism membrane protein [Lachnospiraceae bacterium]
MDFKKERLTIALAGILTGCVAVVLVMSGNPANMGFCLACFIRDTAGGLGLHRAEPVQYIRPEVAGLVLGAFLLSFARKEFRVKGGSAPFTRFILGFFVMIGCLMFLGCPFRMVLRLAGGDLNALFGLAGFAAGIGCGVFFLQKGFSLGRNYAQPAAEGVLFPASQVVLLILLIAAPAFIFFSAADAGPGGKHAPVLLSLGAGLLVGALAQFTRMCMVGAFRDLILFKEPKLMIGFAGIFAAALIGNLITGRFHPGFAEQAVAHTDGLWNFLGMLLAGFGCVLLGGCPLRQMVLAGEGNTDSAVTYLGLLTGAAFCHNFGLASSAAGPTGNGKAAVLIGICVICVIAALNTFRKGGTRS